MRLRRAAARGFAALAAGPGQQDPGSRTRASAGPNLTLSTLQLLTGQTRSTHLASRRFRQTSNPNERRVADEVQDAAANVVIEALRS